MSDPQAMSSRHPIESATGTLDLAVQAAQRGAADAHEAGTRTLTVAGRFVSNGQTPGSSRPPVAPLNKKGL